MDRKAYDTHRALMASTYKRHPLYPLPPKRIVPRGLLLLIAFAAVGAWVVVGLEVVS